MTYEQFVQEIREDKSRDVYLFTGPEDYLKERSVEALEKALLTPGMVELDEMVFESPDENAVMQACEIVPMMSKKRLVIVKDFSAFTSKGGEGQAEKLVKWLGDFPQTCCLVFYMRESADMRKKLSSAIARRGSVVEFEFLTQNRLEKWIETQSSRRGVSFDRGAPAKLLELAGLGLTRLSGELDKLCDYAGKGGRVTKDMIDELVTPTLEARIFQMIDCLMDGNVAKATGLVNNMLQSGETRIGILFMLTRQMRLMTHIKTLRQEGVPQAQIEKRLDIKSYALRRMDEQARRFPLEKLKGAYIECVDADFNIKSGRLREQAALDRIILLLGDVKK
ncbi:MAG: DNA polymerase III subunit delta [Clostridia bacterium]|nr:DNA polymerase III subunit delta [Clostridia bacterium]